MISRLKQFFKRSDSITKRDVGILAAALAVFGAISLGNMSKWSIWFDEAFGVYLIRFNFAEVAQYTANDVHPPLYYWLLKIWQMIFGSSEIALRSLSMVALMGAIIFTYLLIRRAFSRQAAGLAVGLMAISPLLLRYSEEARMYGLAALIVAAATYVLYYATLRPTRKKWIIYAILVSLGMWTHYFTMFMWGAHWVWRYIMVRKKTIRASLKALLSKEWLLTFGFAIALYLPWLPFMVKQMATVQGAGFWIPPVHADTLFGYLTNIFLYRSNDHTTGWLALLIMVLGGLSIWVAIKASSQLKTKQKPAFWLLVVMTIAPAAALILMSMPPLKPAFIERYLIPSIPYVLALIGVSASLVYVRYKKPVILLGMLAVVASVFGIVHLYSVGNYNQNNGDLLPIKETVRGAQSTATDGQPLLAASAWRFYESHYYSTDRNPVYFEATDNLTWGSYDMLRSNDYRKVYDTVRFAQDHGGTVWYIGDWSNGQVSLPKQGTWKVLREVNVDGIPDKQSTIRAAEIQLVSPATSAK